MDTKTKKTQQHLKINENAGELGRGQTADYLKDKDGKSKKRVKLNAEMFWVFISQMRYDILEELINQNTYFENRKKNLKKAFSIIYTTIEHANNFLKRYIGYLEETKTILSIGPEFFHNPNQQRFKYNIAQKNEFFKNNNIENIDKFYEEHYFYIDETVMKNAGEYLANIYKKIIDAEEKLIKGNSLKTEEKESIEKTANQTKKVLDDFNNTIDEVRTHSEVSRQPEEYEEEHTYDVYSDDNNKSFGTNENLGSKKKINKPEITDYSKDYGFEYTNNEAEQINGINTLPKQRKKNIDSSVNFNVKSPMKRKTQPQNFISTITPEKPVDLEYIKLFNNDNDNFDYENKLFNSTENKSSFSDETIEGENPSINNINNTKPSIEAKVPNGTNKTNGSIVPTFLSNFTTQPKYMGLSDNSDVSKQKSLHEGTFHEGTLGGKRRMKSRKYKTSNKKNKMKKTKKYGRSKK
jgi:hypothetical protein